jgi:uncharacterized membrane protein YhdT
MWEQYNVAVGVQWVSKIIVYIHLENGTRVVVCPDHFYFKTIKWFYSVVTDTVYWYCRHPQIGWAFTERGTLSINRQLACLSMRCKNVSHQRNWTIVYGRNIVWSYLSYYITNSSGNLSLNFWPNIHCMKATRPCILCSVLCILLICAIFLQ